MVASLIHPLAYENMTSEQKAAYYGKMARDGRVTNMQLILLHSVTAFRVYSGWYDLYDRLVPIFGERALWIFCYVISEGTDCLLCSTYFRRALVDAGVSPEEFLPTEDEKLLQSAGKALLNRSANVGRAVWEELAARYSEDAVVDLAAFGGIMIATNAFNNVILPPMDDYLREFLDK